MCPTFCGRDGFEKESELKRHLETDCELMKANKVEPLRFSSQEQEEDIFEGLDEKALLMCPYAQEGYKKFKD